MIGFFIVGIVIVAIMAILAGAAIKSASEYMNE